MRDYRGARSLIGLVPQELTTDAFDPVSATVTHSRGLFGKRPNPAHIEGVLRDLTPWDRKADKIIELSGGMKRRVMIAKALSHEHQNPVPGQTDSGVDVECAKMWTLVRRLRTRASAIVLTTHYIAEAERWPTASASCSKAS